MTPTFLVENLTIGGLKERLAGLPDSTPVAIEGLGSKWLVTPDPMGVVIAPAELAVAAEVFAPEPAPVVPLKSRKKTEREE